MNQVSNMTLEHSHQFKKSNFKTISQRFFCKAVDMTTLESNDRLYDHVEFTIFLKNTIMLYREINVTIRESFSLTDLLPLVKSMHNHRVL